MSNNTDRARENAGAESPRDAAEMLVEAMKLVGDFARKNPEAAADFVRQSLAMNAAAPDKLRRSSQGSGETVNS